MQSILNRWFGRCVSRKHLFQARLAQLLGRLSPHLCACRATTRHWWSQGLCMLSNSNCRQSSLAKKTSVSSSDKFSVYYTSPSNILKMENVYLQENYISYHPHLFHLFFIFTSSGLPRSYQVWMDFLWNGIKHLLIYLLLNSVNHTKMVFYLQLVKHILQLYQNLENIIHYVNYNPTSLIN